MFSSFVLLFIRYKTKKKHDRIKTSNLQVDKKIKYSGKKPYSDHNIAVIILENKTQK